MKEFIYIRLANIDKGYYSICAIRVQLGRGGGGGGRGVKLLKINLF